MLREFESYPVGDMIKDHQIKLGKATAAKGVIKKTSWEREDQEDLLRSQGKSD